MINYYLIYLKMGTSTFKLFKNYLIHFRTSGAKELNLIKFIDLYILNMMNDKEKRLLKISLDSFIEDCVKENNYSKMEDITDGTNQSGFPALIANVIAQRNYHHTK